MRGFILSIKKAKGEDIVVTILSLYAKESYYRFYGARHSIIQVGYLIDFELLSDNSRYLPRLKSVRHIDFPWILEDSRVDVWREFIQALDTHLKDKSKLDSFYFELLLKSAFILDKQNPKRVAIESYLHLLEFENRLISQPICLICQTQISQDTSLMQGYKMAHPNCINKYSFNTNLIIKLFQTKSTIDIEDRDIDWLFTRVIDGF